VRFHLPHCIDRGGGLDLHLCCVMNLPEHDDGTTTNLQEQESGRDEPAGTGGKSREGIREGITEYRLDGKRVDEMNLLAPTGNLDEPPSGGGPLLVALGSEEQCCVWGGKS
jgi:hypothetical protein